MSTTLTRRAASKRARGDIDHQKALDTRRRSEWPCLLRRYMGLLDAREAADRGEEGARWALRQALVDMASVCETIAATMEPPRLRD